ncbi:ISAs1 family transposase [Nocardiopsis sp. LOL_012]|uniref:ISAs1 family transposase n=1 Tax=Nocardiopsis sp. LOL_012 TaxID=3345409 RepID=UPI003A8AD4F6
MADKTSEIDALAALLEGLDLEGSVISADALHTRTDTAEHLVNKRKAHYVLTVKRNQPTLFAQVKALPWGQAPTLFPESGRGHGRAETRTVKVLTAPGIAFGHAKQVLRVHRWVKESATGKVRRTYAYVVTSLSAEQAGPERLAGLARGHWRIEALHHVRDVSFGEDASRVRTGHGPQNMAMLRNLAVPLLAGLGMSSIPEAVRGTPGIFTRKDHENDKKPNSPIMLFSSMRDKAISANPGGGSGKDRGPRAHLPEFEFPRPEMGQPTTFRASLLRHSNRPELRTDRRPSPEGTREIPLPEAIFHLLCPFAPIASLIQASPNRTRSHH